jgi:hypothetical protein
MSCTGAVGTGTFSESGSVSVTSSVSSGVLTADLVRRGAWVGSSPDSAREADDVFDVSDAASAAESVSDVDAVFVRGPAADVDADDGASDDAASSAKAIPEPVARAVSSQAVTASPP